MLLNEFNKKKENQILKKYKLDNKFKIKIILFNNMIFITEKIKEIQIINILIISLLKWKQLNQIQKKLFNSKFDK